MSQKKPKDLRDEFFAHCAEPRNYSEGQPPYACPCCDYLTLDSRGDYHICPVCFWEDDGTDDLDHDTPFNPNHMTLREGRTNFAAFGACERGLSKNVRLPKPSEAKR